MYRSRLVKHPQILVFRSPSLVCVVILGPSIARHRIYSFASSSIFSNHVIHCVQVALEPAGISCNTISELFITLKIEELPKNHQLCIASASPSRPFQDKTDNPLFLLQRSIYQM